MFKTKEITEFGTVDADWWATVKVVGFVGSAVAAGVLACWILLL